MKPDVSRGTNAGPTPSAVSPGVRFREKTALPPIREAPQIEHCALPPTRPTGIGPIARPAAGYDRLTRRLRRPHTRSICPTEQGSKPIRGSATIGQSPFRERTRSGPNPAGRLRTSAKRVALSRCASPASHACRRRRRLRPIGTVRASLHARPERRFEQVHVLQDYDTFLRPIRTGRSKRLAVVAEWVEASLNGPVEKLRHGLGD